MTSETAIIKSCIVDTQNQINYRRQCATIIGWRPQMPTLLPRKSVVSINKKCDLFYFCHEPYATLANFKPMTTDNSAISSQYQLLLCMKVSVTKQPKYQYSILPNINASQSLTFINFQHLPTHIICYAHAYSRVRFHGRDWACVD